MKPEEQQILLKNVPIKFETAALMKLLHLGDDPERAAEFQALVEEAEKTADPDALYKPVFIEKRGEDYIVCEGVTLRSRVLAVNVEKVYRIFPFVATAGPRLEEWADQVKDPVMRFWAETIKGFVLISTINALEAHIRERYATGTLSRMNPGSLPDWPLSEQSALFLLLGETSAIGVSLKDDLFMIPKTTVSGLWFPTEIKFESCMLCPMEHCPGRRAPFDKGLFANKYGRTG